MSNPFVKSNYARVPNDYYPTIDPRCVDALLSCIDIKLKCADVCAPNGSGIVDRLIERGENAICIADAFCDFVPAFWIVTNPPYKRGMVDAIIQRQIERIEKQNLFGLVVLLRSTFDHAKSRACMFADNPFYYGQVKLLFRPWWSDDHKASPIHNYCWHIWKRGRQTRPVVLYAGG